MGRIEGILFKALQEHARRINRSFKELGASIQAWFAGNREEVEKKVIIISTLEKEASKLKKNLLTEVASEEEDPHRPDYIRLILQMDEAAGFAGGAAVRLGFIDFTPEENDPIIEKFNRLITLFINIGDALTSAIKWADDNVQKALEYCDQIDSIESQIEWSISGIRSISLFSYGYRSPNNNANSHSCASFRGCRRHLSKSE